MSKVIIEQNMYGSIEALSRDGKAIFLIFLKN